MQNNETFKAAQIAESFINACNKFDALLASKDSHKLVRIHQAFHQVLRNYQEEGVLKVAFIGQYSAGKSTLISALTGRRDIHIDADIATDKTTNYDWNGIQLIDTPGLFTDREDHDDIAYDAITKADLLVFCLTSMLFDSITIENFKKLAYEKSYRWKMMLVINKMSDEAGEEEQKISSYRHSLGTALKPYSFTEFPVCFIDAKDYCDGKDEDDDFLIEISHFQTFIQELNQFTDRRASLSQLDTPTRIALSCVDNAQIFFTRNSGEDTAFLEVLSRLKRRVQKERDRIKTKVNGITLEMSAAIMKEGMQLSAVLGKENFDQFNKTSEANVHQHYENARQEIKQVAQQAIESLHTEVQEELQSDLTQALIAKLDFNSEFYQRKQQILAGDFHQNLQEKENTRQLKQQVDWLTTIGDKVGASLEKLATASKAQGFLSSSNVAGSSLHNFIYTAGKFIGYNFKPWEAVNMAKNLGNTAMFLGPALAILSIVVDIYASNQEREIEQQMAEIRNDITSQFQTIAKDLEVQIGHQLHEFEIKFYGEIESKISEARKQHEHECQSSCSELKQLNEVRQEFENIIQTLAKQHISSQPTFEIQ
jgi:small GTP-binding protein